MARQPFVDATLISPSTLQRWSTSFVVLAAFSWGMTGGMGGILMDRGYDPIVISFYRALIGVMLVALWLGLRPRSSGLSSGRLWFWSLVAGVGVAGNFGFYFLSISEGSVAVAATLMYCSPIFVYLVSFALGLETPTVFKWIAIVMVMMGIVLLTEIYDVDEDGVTMLGVVAGLLAGVSYALFLFGFKYAAPHGSPQAILLIAFSLVAAVLFVLADAGQTVKVLGSPNWALFVAVGILGAALSFALYIAGLNYTAPAIASMVAMVEPVTASLFGLVVLGETMEVLQFAGMALILITVTALGVGTDWVPLPKRWRKRQPTTPG